MTIQAPDALALQCTLPAWKAITGRFLLFYALATLILTALTYGILHVEANLQLTALEIHESGQVEIASRLLAHDFEGVSSDLMVLAHAPSFIRFLDQPTVARKEQVTDLLVTLAGEKQIYDKIRYIDAQGRDVVRVTLQEGLAVVAPETGLLDESQSHYFQEAIRLGESEVYVSPLDLDMTNGKIERPYKPVVRFATPVFDGAHHRKGVMVLNLHGARLIDHLHLAIMDDEHAMLLNSAGDWLSNADPDQEWGFMFNRPSGFARQFPAEWQVISENEWGTFKTTAGLFTYTTVNPLQASQPLVGTVTGRKGEGVRLPDAGYFWKIVSHVPADELPSAALSRHPVFLWAYGGGLALAGGLASYLAFVQYSRQRLRQAIFDNERILRELAQTLAEGVYVLDGNGRIAYINPEAKRLLGWPVHEDMMGLNAHVLFHHKRPDGRPLPEDECPVTRVIQSGQAYRNDEEAFWRKDGTMIPVRISSSPIMRKGRVTGSVVAFQDISARKQAQEEIRRLAYYDTLTGLPNRRLFMDRLNHAVTQARRYHRAMAVMFLDLDRFKEVNDTLGHDVGDELLKVVAARLKAEVRGGDTVARQGGDEFVILLSEISVAEDAVQVAEKLLSALRAPVEVAGHPLRVSGSIGIAIYSGRDERLGDVQELMKRADMSMYAAKQAGRDRYCLQEC